MITEEAPLAPPVDRTRPPAGRPRARRRGASGRAVLGGLLVSVAALGAIVIASSGSGPDAVDVVVASRPIAPGDRLGDEVLRIEQIAVPSGLLESTFADVAELEGTVSRSSLSPGELLQQGDVVASTAAQRAAAPSREITLHLDADRVGGGALEAGDRVDVIATYGTGTDAVSTVVLVDAAVLSARSTDGAIGSARGVVVTLALDSRADTVALAHAADVAQVRIVRTTTATPDEGGVAPYRVEDADSDPTSRAEESRR